MNITTFSKRYMNYEYYSKRPMQMVEMTSKMIISKNSHFINAPDRSIIHPLIKKYSTIPFN